MMEPQITNPNLVPHYEDSIQNANLNSIPKSTNSNSEPFSPYAATVTSTLSPHDQHESSSSDVYSEAEDDIVEDEASESEEEYVDSDEELRKINYYKRTKAKAALTNAPISSISVKRGRKPRAPGEPPRPRGPPRGPRGPYKPRKPKDPNAEPTKKRPYTYRPSLPIAEHYIHPNQLPVGSIPPLPPQAILVPMLGPNGVRMMVPYLPASMVMAIPSSDQSQMTYPPAIPLLTSASGTTISTVNGQLIPGPVSKPFEPFPSFPQTESYPTPPVYSQSESQPALQFAPFPPKPHSSPSLDPIVDPPSFIRERARRSNVKAVDYSLFDKSVDVGIDEEEDQKGSLKEVTNSANVVKEEKIDIETSDHTDAGEDDDAGQHVEPPFVEKILACSIDSSIITLQEAITHNDTHALITPGTEHQVDSLRLLSTNRFLDLVLRSLDSSSPDAKSHRSVRKASASASPKISPFGSSDYNTALFLVKITNRSYWHTEWVTKALVMSERGGHIRYHRFMTKALGSPELTTKAGLPFFDEEMLKPELILDLFIEQEPEKPVSDLAIPVPSGIAGRRSFLIKWKHLSFDSATWEYEEHIRSHMAQGGVMIKEFMDQRQPTKRRLETARMVAEAQRMNMPLPRPHYVPLSEAECDQLWGSQGRQLRPYQQEGVDWLAFCWCHRQPSIIADEMGLGKTIQAAAFLARIFSSTFGDISGPFLIVAPLSCVPHWERELRIWAPALRMLLYQGKASDRDALFDYLFFSGDGTDGDGGPRVPIFDILLCSYDMAVAGLHHLIQVFFRVAIFDEAHRLKNKSSRLAESLGQIRVEHKVLLTGTPLQNSIEELFALLSFMQPWRFNDEAAFMAAYGKLERPEDVAKVQELLRPLMLRRMKEDVETSIPVREETVIEVELTPYQKQYYRAILERNLQYLTGGGGNAGFASLSNAMIELRKLCMHPLLLGKSNEHEAGLDSLLRFSAKMMLVDKLLRKLREQGRRVLIFSQMTRMLDLLEELMDARGYPWERIDGRVRGELRQAAIDRFCDLSRDCFVFLLCTRAGGQGINLTAADTVIIYDSDWNPQNDLQAMARCHRIGQTKPVTVYRLICAGTYEQEMLERAGMKLGLDRAILQRMPADGREVPTFTRAEIEQLLRRGAYGAMFPGGGGGGSSNSATVSSSTEENIDEILSRRTRIISHSAEETSSIFSKASFAPSKESGCFGVDVDDPNFWALWARHMLLAGEMPLLEVDERVFKRQQRRLAAPLALFCGVKNQGLVSLIGSWGLGRSKVIGSHLGVDEMVVFARTEALLKKVLGKKDIAPRELVADSVSLLLELRDEREHFQEKLHPEEEVEVKSEPISDSVLLRCVLSRSLGRILDVLFSKMPKKGKKSRSIGHRWLDQDPEEALSFLGVTPRSPASSRRGGRSAVGQGGGGLSTFAAALAAHDWPSPMAQTEAPMPSWWSVPLHDAALLLASWLWGFDVEPSVLFSDSRLFPEEASENLPTAEQSEARLKQIILCVGEQIEMQLRSVQQPKSQDELSDEPDTRRSSDRRVEDGEKKKRPRRASRIDQEMVLPVVDGDDQEEEEEEDAYHDEYGEDDAFISESRPSQGGRRQPLHGRAKSSRRHKKTVNK